MQFYSDEVFKNIEQINVAYIRFVFEFLNFWINVSCTNVKQNNKKKTFVRQNEFQFVLENIYFFAFASVFYK